MSILEKVISGAQNGVDQAALRAATLVGFRTGGWVPRCCMTQDGPRPELIKMYGLVETRFSSYPERTCLNVQNSDGTLRIAKNFRSAGERCTYNAVRRYGAPMCDVSLYGDGSFRSAYHGTVTQKGEIWQHDCVSKNAQDVYLHIADWIHGHNIQVLNVAGNSEKTAPGIGDEAERFLYGLFMYLRKAGD